MHGTHPLVCRFYSIRDGFAILACRLHSRTDVSDALVARGTTPHGLFARPLNGLQCVLTQVVAHYTKRRSDDHAKLMEDALTGILRRMDPCAVCLGISLHASKRQQYPDQGYSVTTAVCTGCGITSAHDDEMRSISSAPGGSIIKDRLAMFPAMLFRTAAKSRQVVESAESPARPPALVTWSYGAQSVLIAWHYCHRSQVKRVCYVHSRNSERRSIAELSLLQLCLIRSRP